jgi:hypothetical protein
MIKINVIIIDLVCVCVYMIELMRFISKKKKIEGALTLPSIEMQIVNDARLISLSLSIYIRKNSTIMTVLLLQHRYISSSNRKRRIV